MSGKFLKTILFMLLTLSLLLAACQPAVEVIEQAPAEQEESSPTEVAVVEEEETKVGGTLVIAMSDQPTTLDAHYTSSTADATIAGYIGASLIALDPEDSGNLLPYLAKSWEISDDGLKITFNLRDDVLFHNGDPLTAQDYVWTFQRMMDEQSPAYQLISNVKTVELLDDYSFQLTLGEPEFVLLYTLSDAFRYMPLSQQAVESAEDYGYVPVSVGPYVFKEWEIGSKIILERNPDFNWGPYEGNQDAFNIETLEFRYLPEYAIQIAGLEAGELDIAIIQPKDLELVEALGYQLFDAIQAGLSPYIQLNWSYPPFEDVRVRKAFNLALDKEAIINIVVEGQAVPQYGPCSPTVLGYWTGSEDIGYPFDLDQAKALMIEAGWTDSDGDDILDKEGQPLHIEMLTPSNFDMGIRLAEVVQEQYRQLGVEIELVLQEHGLNIEAVGSGDYQAAVYSLLGLYPDWYAYTHYTKGLNLYHGNDTEMDQLIEEMFAALTVEQRTEAVNNFQEYFIENAVAVPLFASTTYYAVSARIQDVSWSDSLGTFFFHNAYINDAD